MRKIVHAIIAAALIAAWWTWWTMPTPNLPPLPGAPLTLWSEIG